MTDGRLNETSLAIGELREGLKRLSEAHEAKASEDREFRKAGYKAFDTIDRIADIQAEHGKRLDAHDDHIQEQEKHNSRQKGVMLTLGAVGSGVTGLAALAFQYVTRPGGGN